MAICIPKENIKKFKEALGKRELDIKKMLNMTTEARTTLLEKFVGDQAKAVNTLFEEKLVLKNRLAGLKNWVAKVGEVGRFDPAKKAKLAEAMSEFREKQQERIFSPKEEEAFLRDLAEKKLGTDITRQEAQTLFEFSGKMGDLRNKSYD